MTGTDQAYSPTNPGSGADGAAEQEGTPPVHRPEEGVEDLCARLIRFDTTNRGPGDSEGEREAAEYVAGVLTDAGLSPTLLESAPRRANVVVRIPGTDPNAEAVLVHAHLDVVPADPGEWSVPPFSGEIRDGLVWGRGAVDMKDMCAMVLAVVRSWSAAGLRPRRDIVLAFVADEEAHGDYGASWLVDEHPDLFAGCAIGISESGGHTFDVDGVRLYPVAAAERGTIHLRLTARGRAGHGSRPNPDNAVVRLAHALARIAAYEWPVRLTPTVRAFLERTGAALGVDVDLSGPAGVDATIERLGKAGALATATVRATATPTMLDAGYKINVIPGTAHANLDGRALPGAEQEFLDTIDELLGPHVERETLDYTEAVSAPIDSPWFDAMAAALRTQDPDAVVVPYCMGGGTDAKSFARLGIAGYGFSPLRLPADFPFRGLAHGVDERVPVDGLRFGARVLDHFLRTV
ncbi:Acetylornithine deacetylase/Succinyl-diaminopimelate desuccinylase [Actinopolymorpha cephalotaxi]|uniref:Acetylornithine deacetylase/Succinyl-diaminopimelate desuccinylase n=1 Tax=Actinopolymorpha cephalotaxi TaxID=504797 RepID=A0A1I2PIW8_9ACTN|nr:M20/M25/M40 family metallo-hydrolase [Actinopolymorpha cephalotaxi]NYH83591.1 acetylornithine deacetylase/succinyl-diaminopimelate desuccinylase-like protein [Actinopolymorpha cephalotaxi]SFG15994.1 Acetylornithine deacetylase/Succinyl-diaminopimelate desuccinylase [Actinopolymorpha cephalotaxi]